MSTLGRISIFFCITLLLIILLPFTVAADAENEYQLIPGVIALDSSLSGGPISPEEIIKRVREAGLKVAIFSDKDYNKIEYGLFPLRNLLKVTQERGSLNGYGAKRYLNHIEDISRRYPDMVILPGTETSTFYYWEGSVFKFPLEMKIKNYHKNFLVFGMQKASDYTDLEGIRSDA